MELEKLFQGIRYTGRLPKGEAALVAQDSRRVTPGAVFVCIEGRGFDGHAFGAKALEQGALLVVTQRPLGLDCEVQVESTREVYGQLCQNFFGRPGDEMTLVAVTGTNGKTTVAATLKQALENLGHRCGFIGTIQNEIGPVAVPSKFTTPEAWDLAALLHRMKKAGCSHVVMEASSQALAQGRLAGLRFGLGIFTNLTQDHLDYHGDMERYYTAKKSLFDFCDIMLTNSEDDYGKRLLDVVACPQKYSFSVFSDGADFTAKNIELKAGGVRFAFLGDGYLLPVRFPIPGEYSVANALAAVAAAVLLGEDPARAAEAVSHTQGVRGRCQVLYNGGFTIIRDFAHTGDALEKLLKSLRPFAEGRMVVLFGCAGVRDAAKRPAMGEAAARYGDEIYITADNPRTEPVLKTIEDALGPVKESGKSYHTETNRMTALEMALAGLGRGDMLVLCGKGHEDYQVLDGVTLYFDEAEIVKQWLADRGLK